MSIPPLVCSTPPPPEQCEDDKDHEDFDLTYHLSQDDDEDSADYNYGNFSNYNTYPPKAEESEKENWPTNLNTIEITENSKNFENISDTNFIQNDNLFHEITPKFEENALEDLNLQVNSNNIHSSEISSKEYETDVNIYNCEFPNKNSLIQDQGGTDILEKSEETINTSDSTKIYDPAIPTDSDKLDFKIGKDDQNTEDSSVDIPEIPFDDKLNVVDNEESAADFNCTNDPEILTNEFKDKNLSEDEFGDFEDFQFTVSSNTQALSVNNENPWDNNTSESPSFGDFKANFEESVTKEIVVETVAKSDDNEKGSMPGGCDDDDFGDFDDFKSSTIQSDDAQNEEIMLSSNVSMLNLHSPENEIQIVDSINSVLTSIFTKDITECQDELEGKLELCLGETWGHLVDIDVRQPYIINWNNSLGQKTLLKALCIDSRNILFGPKWHYSTPKYATSLSTAPLQPQKQPQSNTSATESSEKVPNNAPSWIDPFTPDGQESCSAESEAAKPEAAKRPSDLDIFESESSKPNKIYSNTINIQPLRHINLPDTHIFTPTDSEEPRSKTIHYDNSLPLVPQPISETVKSQTEHDVSQPRNSNENEYWDFQDFKGSTEVSVKSVNQTVDETVNNSSSENVSKPGVTYQTQILQPIKLEPIIPTLNWPDPGEVKETFDDFSDFVSSQSWNEKDNINTKEQTLDTKDSEHNNLDHSENIEDEFETFQSAPIGTPEISVGFTSPQNTLNAFPTVNENIDITPFNSEETIMGSQILFTDNKILPATNPNLQDAIFPKAVTSNVANHVNNDILQPTNSSAATVRNQHNIGQILQPLSLESYSQINWPNPGIDLQDLSRFNPINSLNSLKSDASAGNSKIGSPMHVNSVQNETVDDDIWGDFVSSAPKTQTSPKKNFAFADDDEWTDFVSSPSIKPQNGLNTISLNVHTNSSMHKAVNQNKLGGGSSQIQLDIPALNYITPKSNNRGVYMEKHFQNL